MKKARPYRLTAWLTVVLTAALPSLSTAQAVEYYHLDALGSVRAVTNQAGVVIERHDFYAYGEECTTAPCGAQPGTNTKKFTGKERDFETGLDYFGARYHRANVGRFTTIDPVYTWRENLLDSQRWNRYSYARNNPLRYTDPDGRFIVPVAIALGVLFLVNNVKYAGDKPGRQYDTIVPNTSIVAIGFGGVTGGFVGAAEVAALDGLDASTGVPISMAIPGGGLRKLGRAGKQFKGPVEGAEGVAHTRFRRDGDGVTHYETYNYPETGVGKRVDVVGPPHGGVETPHVVETRWHQNPNDPTKGRFTEGPTRAATPDEVPPRRE